MIEILLAKLMPPRVGKGIIDRPRLIKLFNRFDERKLTLLLAPAGYGKTVLMLQLSNQAKRTAVWYQLDAGDNDPAVFLQYLTMGLQRHFPALETKFSQLIEQENFESGLKLWVNVIVDSLQKVEEPLLLSFDDYHVITEPVLHKFIQQLLAYLPAHIHIMITSRTTPPFNLSRLKISDEILVLKAEELRFTKEELQDFLTERSIYLPSENLEFLNQEVNGWPAAIKLAAGSLSGNTFSLKTLLTAA